MHHPAREEFLGLNRNAERAPIWLDVLADLETPLSAYWKIAHDEGNSFLLESVTGGEQLARYSILGVRPRLTLRTKGRRVRRISGDAIEESNLSPDHDPLDLLMEALSPCFCPEGMPKFFSGAVGMLGYDVVRFFEKLEDQPQDDLEVDDLAMMLVDNVVVFDHARNLLRIIVTAPKTAEGYEQGVAEIDRVVGRLRGALPALPNSKGRPQPVTSNMSRQAFENGVRRIKHYIEEGDGIQMVLSQRFQTACEAHPITVYRSLRSLNPSPYMFLLRFGDFDLVGASPELLVSLSDGTARVRPIAGTRWRGATPAEDDRLAADLLADEKELAEHIMLVDLGRNDLGRVSEYGSIAVNDLMVVERYSHVMHIVSDVTGRLAANQDEFSLLRATFPAGTVSGAPKVRAMQIIDELEPTSRGSYAGAVGYLGANGDMDTAIAIRTIFMRDGMAYVQAGADIVHDSDPSKEFEETCNKAKACLKALEMAQVGLETLD